MGNTGDRGIFEWYERGEYSTIKIQRRKVGRGMRDTYEKRVETLEYYMSLMMTMMDTRKFPFFALIIQKGITKEEVEYLLAKCEALSEEMTKQKREGLLWFYPLLLSFKEALPANLSVLETVKALEEQGLYTQLMFELKKSLIQEK
jgi:Protein of unknown function (DUF1878)